MSEALDHMSRLCWQLAKWQDGLPACLRILTSHDTIGVGQTLETTRLRVLLSLRYLGVRILALRPVLAQFLDLPGATAASPSEQQSRWLRKSGAVLLDDLVRTSADVLHISKGLLVAARNANRNLLGAWWFSCYYSKHQQQCDSCAGCEWANWCISTSFQRLARRPGDSCHQADSSLCRRPCSLFCHRVTPSPRLGAGDPRWVGRWQRDHHALPSCPRSALAGAGPRW